MDKLLNGFNDGLHPSSGIGGEPGAFDENGDAITRGYVKPMTAKQYFVEEMSGEPLTQDWVVEHLERFANLNQEKFDKVIQQREEVCIELQQAKELLKRANSGIKIVKQSGVIESDTNFSIIEEIEEFLKQ